MNAQRVAKKISESVFFGSYPQSVLRVLVGCEQEVAFKTRLKQLFVEMFPLDRFASLHQDLANYQYDQTLFMLEKMTTGLKLPDWSFELAVEAEGDIYDAGTDRMNQWVLSRLFEIMQQKNPQLALPVQLDSYRTYYDDSHGAGCTDSYLVPYGILDIYDSLGQLQNNQKAQEACPTIQAASNQKLGL